MFNVISLDKSIHVCDYFIMSMSKEHITVEWFTPAQAAAHSHGIANRITFLRWAREGLIEAIELPNGRWKISRTAVDALLTPATPAGGIPVGELEGQTELELRVAQ